MNEQEIDIIIEKSRKRDTEALAVLCEHFYPQILKYMYYRVDAVLAEDLTGEVFLRVLTNIHKQKGSFYAWLYKIAAHVIIDHARKGKTRKEVPMNEQISESVASPGNAQERTSRRIDMSAAITRLTDEQRELITLKFIQGLSNEDIAEITNRSQGAIRGLQFRALSALKIILSSEKQSYGF